MGDFTKKRRKKRASSPFEQPEAIPTFLDPEFDGLEEAELDIQDQYRGRVGDDAD